MPRASGERTGHSGAELRRRSPGGSGALAEPRQARGQVGERREALVRVNRREASVELLLLLDVVRIRDAAVYRAHRVARFLVVEPDALGAEGWVDDVDVLALADGA